MTVANDILDRAQAMNELILLTGIPLFPSRHTPEGKLIQTADGIYFHSRLSTRGKMRRPHGRGRPAKRHWKSKTVLYQPDYERLRQELTAV